MKAVIYARVSTSSQTCENQLASLRAVAARNGWQVVRELKDEGISGAKGRADRPAWDELHRMVARKQCDIVLTWSIDRLGRSIAELIGFMKELSAVGVDLYCEQQSLNTQTASGRLCFAMFAALGEYERELIRERVLAGLATARRNGRKLGRPTNVNAGTRTAVRELRQRGLSIGAIAKTLRIGVGTTRKMIAAA
jgi:DNA invertase Pin-like site-specific DNA recombinase